MARVNGFDEGKNAHQHFDEEMMSPDLPFEGTMEVHLKGGLSHAIVITPFEDAFEVTERFIRETGAKENVKAKVSAEKEDRGCMYCLFSILVHY